MHKVRRKIWAIVDVVVAVIFGVFMFILASLFIESLFGIMGQDMPTIIADLPFCVISALHILGGMAGITALAAAALLPAKQVCTNRRQKILILAGLIIGIFSAVWFLPAGPFDVFRGALYYMVISAIAHIIELVFGPLLQK